MRHSVRRGCVWITVVAGCLYLILGLTSCVQQGPEPDTAGDADGLPAGTADPAIVRTLQADIALTAVSVVTVTQSATPATGADLVGELTPVAGTPPAGRVGECPVPAGSTTHVRQGFCLSAPVTWTALNVDGGMAGFLRTTPGKALSLQPEWAQSTAVCHVMVYVSAESSAAEHLQVRHDEIASRPDVQQISSVQMQTLGEMALAGFVWSISDGSTGAAYADLLGPERLLHISYGGTNCPAEDIVPILDTIRVR